MGIVNDMVDDIKTLLNIEKIRQYLEFLDPEFGD